MRDKVIVITGGASGIGLSTAKKFASLGAKAIYSLDIQATKNSSPATHFECDVRNSASIRNAIEIILKNENRIDILFANAGKFHLGDIEETSDAVFEDILATNLKGTWYAIQAVIPAMKKRGKGAVIINGSDQCLVGRPKSAVYGLTKGAIGQLTKSLALDYAKSGIRVNCVCPAAIETPLCGGAIEDWSKRYGGDVSDLTKAEHELQPIGRMGTPEDVANLVAFLASDEARNITGALISTDGGYVAQ